MYAIYLYILYFCSAALHAMHHQNRAFLILPLRKINTAHLFNGQPMSTIRLKESLGDSRRNSGVSLYDILTDAGIEEVAMIHPRQQILQDESCMKQFLKTFLRGIFLFKDQKKVVLNIEPLMHLFSTIRTIPTRKQKYTCKPIYNPFNHTQYIRPAYTIYQGHWLYG